MALPNLSKKFLKIGFVESLFIDDQLRKRYEAALEFLSALNLRLVASDDIPHAATILSAAAWLTGFSLYQSLQVNENSVPGTIVTPQDLNREWEHLVYLLEKYNFQRADIPVGHVVLAAMAAPLFFKPRVELRYVQRELQEKYNSVMRKHGFDPREGMHVGIILCSILIEQYQLAGMIATDAATGIVAQGIFEAARQCLLP
jgi:hypothetical protein